MRQAFAFVTVGPAGQEEDAAVVADPNPAVGPPEGTARWSVDFVKSRAEERPTVFTLLQLYAAVGRL